MRNDDSDMKIAGEEFKSKPALDDVEETSRLLEMEKASGNLSRARRLGAIMADEVAAVEGDDPAKEAVFVTQRRILMAFAVEVALETLLPNSILSETARSVFYETLRKTAPSIYEDLQGSGAFSFYYLALREGKDVVNSVGEAYASLCGRAGDKALAKKGGELYVHFIEQARELVESFGFVEFSLSGQE